MRGCGEFQIFGFFDFEFVKLLGEGAVEILQTKPSTGAVSASGCVLTHQGCLA